MTRRPPLALALALVLLLTALTAAGCGGQGSTPKSRLIARADAICKPLNARRSQANAQVGAVTGVAALPKVARVAPGLAAYERAAIAELRTLTVPASLTADWQKILAGAQQLAANTAKLGDEAKGGNLKEVEAVIHQDQQSERELIAIATAVGFKHCGRNA
jgi:hypothetical protein